MKSENDKSRKIEKNKHKRENYLILKDNHNNLII